MEKGEKGWISNSFLCKPALKPYTSCMQMKFSLHVLFLSLLLRTLTYGQGTKDSLIHTIAIAKEDTAKVMLLLKIADLY